LVREPDFIPGGPKAQDGIERFFRKSGVPGTPLKGGSQNGGCRPDPPKGGSGGGTPGVTPKKWVRNPLKGGSGGVRFGVKNWTSNGTP